MMAYEDPEHPGNGKKYRTGKSCIEECGRPAGTWWSPLWCFECNIKRMRRVSASLESIIRSKNPASDDQR